MFTGIIAEVGTIQMTEHTVEGRTLRITALETVADAGVGASIAVNGVCLTVTNHVRNGFECHAVAETLDRTTLDALEIGDRVNLERPMAASGRFDGHIVQGHVDGIGRISAVDDEGDARRLRVEVPDDLARYIVEKGSIAVDGTSLTVTAVNTPSESAWFDIVLIPHTLATTTFGSHDVGTLVNVEVDVLAKYVERMTEMSR